MAQRKIIRGIRVDDVVYVPGMEDDLSKVLSPEEITRLCAKGYLVWPQSNGFGKQGRPALPSKSKLTRGSAPILTFTEKLRQISKCEACGGDGMIEVGAYRGDRGAETRRCVLCGEKI